MRVWRDSVLRRDLDQTPPAALFHRRSKGMDQSNRGDRVLMVVVDPFLLSQHYPASTVIRPRPTPAMAAAFATLRPLPSPLTGLPRLPEPPFRRAVPTTPADRAGARVDCFPAHTAFPKWQEGRHPHCHFRGLLRLHSRYG